MHKKRITKASLLSGLVFLVALNLRPTITAVGPLLDDIGNSFGLGEAALGFMGALPLIMFALVSPITFRLIQRIGSDWTVFVALLAISIGIILRSYAGAWGLWAGVVLATAAIASGNVILPVIVGREFGKNMALATGTYTAVMGTGAAVASAVAFPIAAIVSWRHSLAVWAIPALLTAVLWALRLLNNRKVSSGTVVSSKPGSAKRFESPQKNLWRWAQTWWLTIYMGLQSATFYFMVTWLPTLEANAGKSPQAAGMTLFWYQLVGMVAGLLIPILMRRTKTQIPTGIVGTVPIILGYLGYIFVPSQGILWAFVMGTGSGICLVFILTLISIWGESIGSTARLSGLVQSFSYGFAAIAPVLAGVIAQEVGNWTVVLILMLGLSLAQLFMVPLTGRIPKLAGD